MWFFSEQFDETPPSASLALDFSTEIPQPFTLARNSTGLGRDSSGRWVSFAANTPRSWQHPTVPNRRYTLIEPARTQLVYRSRQPVLTNVQGTNSVDAAVQTPFGTGAVKFVPNTTSTQHGWNLFFGNANHATTIADNTTVSLTAVMKPSGVYKDVSFFILNRNNVYSSVRVSLVDAGSIVSSTGVLAATIEPDTDDFYTITIVNNFQSGTTAPSFNGGFHNEAGTRTFAGDGVSGFYLAYIGAEAGTEATSPIITPGVLTVTREADVLSSGSAWVQSGAKSIGLTYIPLGRDTDTILGISGTDSINLSNSMGVLTLSGTSGGQEAFSITGAAPDPKVERTVVAAIGQSGASVAQNGAVTGTDTLSAGIPGTFSTVRIGARTDGSAPGPLLMYLLKFWNTALSVDAAVSYSLDLEQDFEETDRPTVTIQPTLTVIPTATSFSLSVLITGELIGTEISYSTLDGTALAGTHYVAASGTLVIQPGEISATINIGLLAREPVLDKTFKISLNSASGATIENAVCEVLLLHQVPAGSAASTIMTFGATLPPEMSLSRTSPAWTRNSTGVWTSVAANGYRRHYISSTVSGLLLEPAPAEQRLFDSVDPAFTASAGTRSVVTTETTPTGNRYLQFREDATTNNHRLSTTLSSSNSDMPTGDFTTTIIIRPVSRRYVSLTVQGIDNIPRTVVFDLSGAGAVVTTGLSSPVTIERDAFRNTWYEISLARPQSASAGVSASIAISSSDGNGSTSIQGATSSGFDIAHVQVEPGAGKSSPIIVTGASAKTVRAADILKATGTWHQRQSYSFGMRFRRLSDFPASQRLWMAKDVSGQAAGVTVQNGIITADAPAAMIASLGRDEDDS